MSLAHHHFSSLPPAPKASMLIEGLCPWPLNPEVSVVDGLKAPSMPSKPWAPSAYSDARFPPGDGLSHLMGLQLQFLWLVLCQALLPGKPTRLSIPQPLEVLLVSTQLQPMGLRTPAAMLPLLASSAMPAWTKSESTQHWADKHQLRSSSAASPVPVSVAVSSTT